MRHRLHIARNFLYGAHADLRHYNAVQKLGWLFAVADLTLSLRAAFVALHVSVVALVPRSLLAMPGGRRVHIRSSIRIPDEYE